MITRLLEPKLKDLSTKFPVIALTGPRQSGKTTLVKAVFPDKPYVSLEDLDVREYATQDPRGFLEKYSNGAIFDEIQRVPELFSYLQTLVDRENKSGMFILTGSQHFLLLENISQTLAGRISLLHLLPFSLEEISHSPFKIKSAEEFIFKGLYPRIYDKHIAPSDWYPSYIATYLERDIRMIKNVHDLGMFQKFLKMCAARTGQIVNLSSLANDCGITHNTIKAWLQILEASFIIYFLRPYHKNFNKRLIKMPKLYFFDAGLAASLLGVENEEQVQTHPLRGNLFETAVISEFLKFRFNRGLPPNCYFWRDQSGNEIDCIAEIGGEAVPIEIKSAKTVTEEFFKNINYWQMLSQEKLKKSLLVYAGTESQVRQHVHVCGWQDLASPDPLLG